MKQPLVSVLMPVYNGAPYIRKSIASILKQTYQNLELIICNDSSTDTTESIVKSFSDERVVYTQNAVRLGLVGNRNAALSLAKGKYIAIMDADDISRSDRLELQIEFLEKHIDYVLCGSWATVINNQGTKVQQWRFPTSSNALKARFYIQFPIVHSSAVMRRSVITSLGLRYEKLYESMEDYSFCFALLAVGKVKVLDVFLVEYRVHASNTIHSHRAQRTEQLISLYKREYAAAHLQVSDDMLLTLIKLYHPVLEQKSNTADAIKASMKLFDKLRRRHSLSLSESYRWLAYSGKALLLNMSR